MAAHLTTSVDLNKLTISQLKHKIRKMRGNLPPGSGKVLRQPYVDEIRRLMMDAENSDVVTLDMESDGLRVSSSSTNIDTPATNTNSSICGEVETTQQLVTNDDEDQEIVPVVIHQHDVIRIVGRDVPCRDPEAFLTVLQNCLNGSERHTFRHISDDFLEKPTHQMSCCDCRYDVKYHSRTQRAGSSVMYCVQCSYVYRGVCRYVVCRDCRTSYEEKRNKERRLKRRLNEPEPEESNVADEEYSSNHEEILFDEWRRNGVRPFYNPWE